MGMTIWLYRAAIPQTRIERYAGINMTIYNGNLGYDGVSLNFHQIEWEHRKIELTRDEFKLLCQLHLELKNKPKPAVVFCTLKDDEC